MSQSWSHQCCCWIVWFNCISRVFVRHLFFSSFSSSLVHLCEDGAFILYQKDFCLWNSSDKQIVPRLSPLLISDESLCIWAFNNVLCYPVFEDSHCSMVISHPEVATSEKCRQHCSKIVLKLSHAANLNQHIRFIFILCLMVTKPSVHYCTVRVGTEHQSCCCAAHAGPSYPCEDAAKLDEITTLFKR